MSYERLTAENAAVLFVDHQTGLANGVQTQTPADFLNNVKALVTIAPAFRRYRTTVTVSDILNTVTQYLGPERARASFDAFAASRRVSIDPNAPADFELLQHAEHLIASSIGAASSRLVMSPNG